MKNKYFISGEKATLSKFKRENRLFDLAITSPPYNKQQKNNGGLVKSVKYNKYHDSMSELEYQEWQIKHINNIFELLKPGGSYFYNHKVRYLNGKAIHPIEWLSKTKFDIRQEIIWDRTIAGNIRGWRFWQTDERIYWLFKPSKNKKYEICSKDAKMTSIWKFMPEGNNDHPAPFPIELPARIIYSMQNYHERKDIDVLDPFAGSGTTGIAANILGANYALIDISKEYRDMFNKRMEDKNQRKRNVEKINDEIERHKVIKTYAQRKREKNGQ